MKHGFAPKLQGKDGNRQIDHEVFLEANDSFAPVRLFRTALHKMLHVFGAFALPYQAGRNLQRAHPTAALSARSFLRELLYQ